MKIIDREDIDELKWNRKIENSDIQNYILYSWAMDATTENWCAVIEGDYDFILPIPFTINLGIKRARQQVYSRQVDFIGASELIPKAINLLKEKFKEFDLRISENTLGETDQHFQFLDLNQELNYSENAKRLIKKSDKKYTYEITKDIKPLIQFYKENTHVKLKQPDANIGKIEALMKCCLKNNKGYVLDALEKEKVVASCFIIEDKSTSVYLIGDASPEEKKNGVIYGLMNFSIQRAIDKKMSIFDFGGSNVATVAKFYKKFGAKDKKYTRITWDKTPFWFKLLKKVKS